MLKGFMGADPVLQGGIKSSLTGSVLKERLIVYGFIQCGEYIPSSSMFAEHIPESQS